jgi:hypothetical protein
MKHQKHGDKHHQNQKREFALELIESAGYKESNEKLMGLGFDKPMMNLKFLERNDGNYEAAL